MSTKRALRIPADPSAPVTSVAVTDLDDYQAAVSGDIEFVEADRHGLGLYLNETGRLDGLRENARASRLAQRLGYPIVGDVLVLGPVDDDGDDTNITSELERFVRETIGLAVSGS